MANGSVMVASSKQRSFQRSFQRGFYDGIHYIFGHYISKRLMKAYYNNPEAIDRDYQ